MARGAYYSDHGRYMKECRERIGKEAPYLLTYSDIMHQFLTKWLINS
jgi:hypothetical protein